MITTPQKSERTSGGRFPLASILIPVLIVGYFSWLASDYQLDDALIYLRYIRNFHEGAGLVYNPGEKFNGLTSPLFSYLVLALSYLVTYQTANIVLCGVCMALAAIVAGLCFAHTTLEFIVISSVIASWSYFYATFGMETPLYLFLIGLSLYLVRKDSERCVISLALLATTRSEGILLALVVGAYYLWRHRRLPRTSYNLLACVIFITPMVCNFLYYGSPIPDTANAKVGQGQSGLWGERWSFLHVGYMRNWFFGGSKFSMLLAPIIAAHGAFIARRSALTYVTAAFLGLLGSFYLVFNIPNYHWYYAPFFYFMAGFFAVSIVGTCKRLYSGACASWSNLALATYILILCWVTIPVIDTTRRGSFSPYVTVGTWLERTIEPTAAVAAVEVGTLGWYCRRTIIDILGLVSPYNSDFIAARDWYRWLTVYQPDYIVRHSTPWPHEISVRFLEDRGFYVVENEFRDIGLVVLKRSASASPETIRRAAAALSGTIQ